MGLYRGHIVFPPFKLTSHGVGLHRQVKHQGNPIRVVPLGSVNYTFGQQFRVFEHLVRWLVNEKSAVDTGIGDPWCSWCLLTMVSIDEHLFRHLLPPQSSK